MQGAVASNGSTPAKSEVDKATVGNATVDNAASETALFNTADSNGTVSNATENAATAAVQATSLSQTAQQNGHLEHADSSPKESAQTAAANDPFSIDPFEDLWQPLVDASDAASDTSSDVSEVAEVVEASHTETLESEEINLDNLFDSDDFDRTQSLFAPLPAVPSSAQPALDASLSDDSLSNASLSGDSLELSETPSPSDSSIADSSIADSSNSLESELSESGDELFAPESMPLEFWDDFSEASADVESTDVESADVESADIEANVDRLDQDDFNDSNPEPASAVEATQETDTEAATLSKKVASEEIEQDAKVATPIKKIEINKKRPRRRILSTGGLQSVVSQGVNVNVSGDAATSAQVDEKAGQADEADSSAALLDALSRQQTNQQTKPQPNQQTKPQPNRSMTSASSSSDIPILVKKASQNGAAPQGSTVQVVDRPQQESPQQTEARLLSSQAQVDRTESFQDAPTQDAPIQDAPTQDAPAQDELGPDEAVHQPDAWRTINRASALARATAVSETEEEAVSSEIATLDEADKSADRSQKAAQYFAEGLAYRNRIEAGERSLSVIEPAIAAYEKGLEYLDAPHPDWITGLNDLGTLYWLKAQQQSDKAEAISCMKKSIYFYQEALSKESAAPTESPANIVGQLYSNSGAVFTMLATCEEPVSHLTQAADSYQKALPLVSAQSNPQEYATLQNSLGSVFWKLSHYEDVETYLHQAIAAYSEALLGYSPDDQPLDYAAVQNNLGITYWSLAKHERPESLLKQAIAAYRDALNYRTSDVDPAACAISYNNLALAYWDLSKHTHADIAQKSRYQKNAVTAFEAALNINNLSGALSPMDSAAIYHCLGDVHAQMTETAPSTVDIGESLQKSLYSYIKSIENLPTDSPAYPPRFGAIVANLRLHYDKLGIEGQQAALNRVPSTLLPQVMMAL